MNTFHNKDMIRSVLRFFAMAAFLFCFQNIDAQTSSKYSLTAEQASKFSALDPETQAKVMTMLQQQDGQGSTVNVDNNLNKDQATAPKQTSGGRSKQVSSASAYEDKQVKTDRPPLYGYDIFTNGNQFLPTIQIATPINYVLGPGDVVEISFYGKKDNRYELSVTREGNLEIPDLGVVNVAGSTFIDARDEIMRRIKTQMIGVEASITMGELRSIRIYVMGEVGKPGSYAVSSLATITNALFTCGGIRETGSLRSIRLMRSGKLVGELDLYDLLIKGDNSHDKRLLPGDVILVPTIGETASVKGQVLRPATYEIKGNANVSDLISLAGGCRADAYLGVSQLKRIDPASRKWTLVSVDLTKSDQYPIHRGDELMVLPMAGRIRDSVKLSGAVALPRSFQWHKGMRLTEIIPSENDLLPDADMMYVLVKHEDSGTGDISVVSTRLDAAFLNPDSKWNLALQPMDEIIVLGNGNEDLQSSELGEGDTYGVSSENQEGNALYGDASHKSGYTGKVALHRTMAAMENGDGDSQPAAGKTGFASNTKKPGNSPLPTPARQIDGKHNARDVVISAIVDRLHRQRQYAAPGNTVTVTGSVRHQGEYPYEPDMHVLDLLRAARDMTPEADMNYALLVHNNNGVVSIVDLRLPVSFDDENSVGNQPLQPMDELHVFSKYSDRQQDVEAYLDLVRRQGSESAPVKIVSINGQVHHPGFYPFREGMRLSDLLRAGGDFDSSAYTLNAEITRSIIEHGRSLSIQHQNVDLSAILNGDVDADILLQPYDNLIIRQIPEWYEQLTVVLSGEVNFPGNYTVRKGETLTQLIKRAGGFTQHSSLKGSVFIRESLRENEQKELNRLRDRLRSDLAATFVEKNSGKSDSEVAQYSVQLLDQLQSAKAIGRMAIDLPSIMEGRKDYPDIILKDGDELYIPQPRQDVMVLGEVMYPTSHLYHKGLTYKEYINMSGGTALHADTKRIYIIKANGMVQTTRSNSAWFASSTRIEPGDSIIVPFDVDYISPLPMWRDITQIIYNLAVSAAAVASF